MTVPENANRRDVLRAVGVGVTGGAVLAGTAAASPENNFGYVETGSALEGETVTLAGPSRREKVFCDAGRSESRIKTEVWGLDGSDEELYLIPSGYDGGDTVAVGAVFTRCTRNDDIEGEVTVTKA